MTYVSNIKEQTSHHQELAGGFFENKKMEIVKMRKICVDLLVLERRAIATYVRIVVSEEQ